MTNPATIKSELLKNGFSIIENIFGEAEISAIIRTIKNVGDDSPLFRKSKDLFAIRQFLKEIPQTTNIIFNDNLKVLIAEIFGTDYFVVKSIYFDKPKESNCHVPWHQDLTISVDKKEELNGYGPWTVKQDQFGVQPPVNILEDNFTLRIHLDKTDKNNGALKVIPGTHANGVVPVTTFQPIPQEEFTCEVPAGGVMIMKPLLYHSSAKTTNQQQRRVIHIEFSKEKLAGNLAWSEKINIDL